MINYDINKKTETDKTQCFYTVRWNITVAKKQHQAKLILTLHVLTSTVTCQA